MIYIPPITQCPLARPCPPLMNIPPLSLPRALCSCLQPRRHMHAYICIQAAWPSVTAGVFSPASRLARSLACKYPALPSWYGGSELLPHLVQTEHWPLGRAQGISYRTRLVERGGHPRRSGGSKLLKNRELARAQNCSACLVRDTRPRINTRSRPGGAARSAPGVAAPLSPYKINARSAAPRHCVGVQDMGARPKEVP